MRFLTHRFVLLLAVLGLGVSFLLGLVARVPVGIVLFRAVVSGIVMGGMGFLFLFVLSRILPSQDFEEFMALLEGRSPSEVSSSLVENSQTEGEEGLQGGTSPGSTVNMVEDSDTWESVIEPSSSTVSASDEWEREVFNPAAAVGSDTDEKEFAPAGETSSLREDYEQLRTEYEKEKPTFKDNTVSFKVNDKKINTSPEIVAKAIKTILSRDS
ncbi:hypothetical protein BREVNS_0304 [Brevinematales bacterium NS]|nr:hypothetical protein [Brevinematales bacterium]QJR21054.1 hypothetical protein BREVNS_0304 [Brevinematales bacterium NS]